LDNGDIAVGCSDNRIYIFTMDDSRKASPEIIALYDAEMAQFQIPRESDNGDELPEEIGGVKLVDMPGPEALNQAGKRDGQTMMVRDGKLVTAHSWSMGMYSNKVIILKVLLIP
jgi:phospholipase A-2-activating protein